LVLTHYLITWLETDGQLGTRDGSLGRPGALLKIFFPTQNSSTPYLTYMHCFLWLRKTNIADTTTGDTITVSRPLLTRLKILVPIPTIVYDGNRLSLPILRQKMAESCVWCLLTCWMVVDMGIKIPGTQVQYQSRKYYWIIEYTE
jgi:hypothetical protein